MMRTEQKELEDNKFTVDEALSFIGNGIFQKKILIITGLLYASDAIEIMILTFLLPILQNEWNLTTAEIGSIGSVIFTGMLFGTLFWSILSDKYGRKLAIILSNIGQIIFGILSAASNDMYTMMILRFLTGFFLGGSVCSFTMCSEYAPKISRGKLLVLQQSFWSMGIFFNIVIAWITLELLNWRWYLIISSLPICIIIIFAFKLPESVRYLVTIGDIEKAENILNNAYIQNTDSNMKQQKIKLIKNQIVINIKKRGDYRDIFNEKYFRESVLLFITYFFTMFFVYGITFLSERFFDKITTSSNNKYLMMMITTSASIPGILIIMFGLDKIGRKKSMYISYIICAIIMFILMDNTIQNINGLSVFLIFIAWICSTTSSFSLYVYFVEYYPTEIRNTSLGIANSLSRFGGMITTYISQYNDITYGFYIYGLASLICFICSKMLKKDTLGNDLSYTKIDDNDDD